MTIPRAFASRDRVSACLIVRNEEKRLGRCLGSLVGWTGEVIVVDTGSTDGTVGIAASFGAQVLHRRWQDDFGWARNVALEAAGRPWALSIDADEVLEVTDAEAFERALAVDQTSVSAFSADCRNLRDDGVVSVAPVMRLFRRDLPQMRFRGEVHEQVIAVAEHKARVAHADFLHLVHDGYTTAVMAEHRTNERNVPLARRMVAARPDEPFAWFCLGQALLGLGDEGSAAEATAAFEHALFETDARKSPRDESYLVSLYLNLVRVLRGSGQMAKAEGILARGLVDFPRSPDLHFLHGGMLLGQGRVDDAATEFVTCLTDEAQAFFVREEPGAAGFAAETQLGLCRVRQGRLTDAEGCFSRAVQQAPPVYGLPALLLGTLLLARGAAVDAEPLLRSVVRARPADVEARLKWAEALLALRRPDDAAAALLPALDDARVAKALDAITRGRRP